MPDFDRWFADRGDETLRFDYRTKPTDVVLDCGAYHGVWSRQMYDFFHCKIIAFEPITAYHKIAVQTLDGTAAIVYNTGIGPKTMSCTISVAGDASSIMTQSGHKEKIQIMSIDDVIREHSLQRIRLMKINIEGAEYDLLDHMIASGIIGIVEDIQVQFHDFVENADIRRKNIREHLRQTHHLTYDYEFVWENWRALDGRN
jgi:FkbM family methyltransferase